MTDAPFVTIRIRRSVAVFIAASAPVCLMLMAFPQLDIAFSQLFFDPATGRFPLADDATVETVRDWLPAPWIALLAAAVLSAVHRLQRGRFLFGLDRKAIAFLLLTVLIGPGLVANVVFKDHWGRARPSKVEPFGGAARMTPALVLADQCTRNCSFVSGEGALAASLVALGFLVRRRRLRVAAFAVIGAYAAAAGLLRIAQGGHFLSDTVFGAVFMIAIAWWLHREIVVRDRLAAPFDRIVHRLRRN